MEGSVGCRQKSSSWNDRGLVSSKPAPKLRDPPNSLLSYIMKATQTLSHRNPGPGGHGHQAIQAKSFGRGGGGGPTIQAATFNTLEDKPKHNNTHTHPGVADCRCLRNYKHQYIRLGQASGQNTVVVVVVLISSCPGKYLRPPPGGGRGASLAKQNQLGQTQQVILNPRRENLLIPPQLNPNVHLKI